MDPLLVSRAAGTRTIPGAWHLVEEGEGQLTMNCRKSQPTSATSQGQEWNKGSFESSYDYATLLMIS